MLKYLFIASFGLTGTLFYLSKQKREEPPVSTVDIPVPETELPKTAPRKKQPAPLAGLTHVSGKGASYAALLPMGEQTQPTPAKPRSPREVFYETYIRPTVSSCYNDLVKRRMLIYNEREGDAELSFDGELQIIATFTDNRVESLRSRSSEVRDDTFHNCIETAAKGWKFPETIVNQGQWSYQQRIAFDVTYRHTCKDTSLRVRASEGSPVVGAGNCF